MRCEAWPAASTQHPIPRPSTGAEPLISMRGRIAPAPSIPTDGCRSGHETRRHPPSSSRTSERDPGPTIPEGYGERRLVEQTCHVHWPVVVGPRIREDTGFAARAFVPAAHDARVAHVIRPRKSRGRGECRVKASPMARQQQEKLAAVTTGSAGSSGIPRAAGYGLYEVSPGTGLFAPVATTRFRALRLASAPGCQNPTTSPSASSAIVVAPAASTAPRLHVRDDRPKRPSSMRRDGRDDRCDLPDGASRLFSAEILKRAI